MLIVDSPCVIAETYRFVSQGSAQLNPVPEVIFVVDFGGRDCPDIKQIVDALQ